MIKSFFTFCGMFLHIWMVIISAFLFLCLNVFTIPLTLLLWGVCRLVKVKTPHFTNYSLMVYPTWSNGPHDTMLGDIKKIKRKEDAKIKRYRPIRAWEERFFD